MSEQKSEESPLIHNISIKSTPETTPEQGLENQELGGSPTQAILEKRVPESAVPGDEEPKQVSLGENPTG